MTRKDWTIDDLFEAVIESTLRTSFCMVHALWGVLTVQEYDLDRIYRNYASAIGKDSLTTTERQQALLNHILEQG